MDVLELSIRLKSGAFESRVAVPIGEDDDKTHEVIKLWLRQIRSMIHEGEAFFADSHLDD